MTLSEAIRTAAQAGCELEPVPKQPGWYAIRAIAYDADPFAISEAELLDLTPELFMAEWIPERLGG